MAHAYSKALYGQDIINFNRLTYTDDDLRTLQTWLTSAFAAIKYFTTSLKPSAEAA